MGVIYSISCFKLNLVHGFQPSTCFSFALSEEMWFFQVIMKFEQFVAQFNFLLLSLRSGKLIVIFRIFSGSWKLSESSFLVFQLFFSNLVFTIMSFDMLLDHRLFIRFLKLKKIKNLMNPRNSWKSLKIQVVSSRFYWFWGNLKGW